MMLSIDKKATRSEEQKRREFAEKVLGGFFEMIVEAHAAKVPKAFEDLIDAKRIVREIKLLSKLTILFNQLFL